MNRHLLILTCLLGIGSVGLPVHGAMIVTAASRSVGASGTVGNDFEQSNDGSSKTSSALGGFEGFAGFSVHAAQGFADGSATHTSTISDGYIAMSASGDANVSSGGGEFDFASGGGNASLDAVFELTSVSQIDISYSGGGYPAYVEPYFTLFQLPGGVVASYTSGDLFESFTMGPGTYSLSAGISAGASTSFPGDSGNGFGGLSFSLSVVPAPEPTSGSLALLAACMLAAWRARRR